MGNGPMVTEIEKMAKGKGLLDGLTNKSPEAVDASYKHPGGHVNDSPTRGKDSIPSVGHIGPRSA